MIIKVVAMCSGLLAAFVLVAQQPDLSKVEIQVVKAGGCVSMLAGAGGNIGASIGEDGILIVDSEFAELAPKIAAALKQIGDEPLRFLINTHWHGDHTGGNAPFAQMSAEIIAHDNVRKRLAAGATNRFGTFPPAAKDALPIITFDDRLSVFVNGEEVRAIHVANGHTDGDSVIVFTRSKVVHMGDDFFNGMFPFIDLDSGGSVSGLIAGIEQVMGEIPDDAKIIPGHGALATKDDLRKFLTMLKETSAAVAAALAQGKTLAQLQKDRVLAPWDAWGQGFIKTDAFTELLVHSLSKQAGGAQDQHGHGR
ncbi:MAG: MBL fold metallo-hydrolase [Planctomycetota bacterium]